jgi:hypothetical protein
MAIVMQFALKRGGDPWLLERSGFADFVAGVYRYVPNEENGIPSYYFNILDGEGKLVYQSVGFSQDHTMYEELLKVLPRKKRGLILVSFEDNKLTEWIYGGLQSIHPTGLAVMRIRDGDGSQLFSTWIPDLVPGSINRMELPMESYEEAPQGIAMESPGQGWYLLTGKTIEKNTLKRGCPTPILVKTIHRTGEWEDEKLLQYIMSLCFMGRASGHMTRVPSPIYYLRLLGRYARDFGLPAAMPHHNLFQI